MRPLLIGTLLVPFAAACAGAALAEPAPGAAAAAGAAHPRASEVETLVVTGSEAGLAAARTEVEATPGGATFVDMAALGERNVGSLADALRYVPGLWSVSDAGTDNIFFSSRGSNLDATDWDMNGIKLLQDGLPVTSADGSNHNRVVDPLAARYATVARGANALAYGASTLGGAVNFVTPTARDAGAKSVSVRGGSHGQRLARLTLGAVAGESFDGLVTAEAKQWDGYREHNVQRRTGLYANAGWRLGERWSTRFFATLLDDGQELPGSLTRAELATDPARANRAAIDGDYRLDVDTRRLANRTSWRIDAERGLDFGFSVEQQALYHPIVWVAADLDGAGPAPATELFSLLIDTDHRDAAAMLRYRQRSGRHELSFGLNYGTNDVDGAHYRNLAGERNGVTALIRNAAETAELFALDRWRVGRATTLVLATQWVAAERDVATTSVASGLTSNPADTYRAVNPRVGFLHGLGGGATVYGNVSRLFEPPTSFELEDNVAGGGATLAPMRGTVVEIGSRGTRSLAARGNWTWDVSVYRARIDDEILSVDDPSAPGTSLATNIDGTLHAGLEGLVRAYLPLRNGRGALEPLVSVALNDFRFDGDAVYGDNDLPAAPRFFVRGEIVYRAASGLFVGPTFERVGRRWADFANGYRVPAHTLVGLRAGWSSGKWRAFAELRNLTGERYAASHAVRNAAAPGAAILNPGEPRSLYFGVAFELP